jgi:hypothetical protein
MSYADLLNSGLDEARSYDVKAFIVTTTKDGKTKKDSWLRKWGAPSKKKLADLIASRDDVKSAKVVDAGGEEMFSITESKGKRINSADGISVGDAVKVTPKSDADAMAKGPLKGKVGTVEMIQAEQDSQRGKGHLAWVEFTDKRLASGSHVNTLDLTPQQGESKAWQKGLSDFESISTPSKTIGPQGAVVGDAGGSGDAPGMATNSQASAQSAAVGEAKRVFAGLYGATPGQKLSIRGQTFVVTSVVSRGANHDWLSMTNRKGEQFVLMTPAKGPNGELNASHLSLMAVGRARTDPFDIAVADLVSENEKFFAEVMNESFGFDRLDEENLKKVSFKSLKPGTVFSAVPSAGKAVWKKVDDKTIEHTEKGKKNKPGFAVGRDGMVWITESAGISEAKIPDWLMKDVDFDLKMGKDYIPAKGVIVNRARGRMRDEVVAIGEKMFGSQFWSEWAGRVLHAGHRDNRDKEKLRKNNQKLAAAITKKGHKVKWDKEGLEFTVTLDPKSDREAEAAHAPYIALLAKKRGVTEDVSHLTEVKANTTLSAAAAQANGLKRVDGKSGDIESGMIVTNGTAYGVFVGSTTGGTVIIQWAKGGILNLVALEKLRAKWL